MQLRSQPPYEQWDHWVEYDPKAWPRREQRQNVVVPTLCFNCEAGCGLLAFIDKERMEIRRIEGNPLHPGSRGHTCAKGPATLNQVQDPERLLYPLKRKGPRGEGGWERVSWDAALDDIAGRIRAALLAERHDGVMYHVGRPGEDGFMNWILGVWGVDGHNSHTNVCSSSTRLGMTALWGSDRPSPDYAESEFILLVSAKLESGHYFNPHAQRITEARARGTQVAVLDIRLSNTASIADHWLPTLPGSEADVLLAMGAVILEEDLADRAFLERWTNWRETAPHLEAGLTSECSYAEFHAALTRYYAERYTLERAERASGVPQELIREVARKAGRAGSRLATHIWRNAASGNLGGWQIARSLLFLNVLTGSVGTPGGTAPHDWHKIKGGGPPAAPAHARWNELLWPPEFPLAHYEVSFLLPHLLLEGRGELDVYFTRVFNPVWTYPDGLTWIDALRDEEKVKLHVALTPTWNETAQFADYVLPVGHSPERHDHQSQETHMGRWIGLRQPVLREARRRLGQGVSDTRDANPGEVWEEMELFLALTWRIDPDGSLGIRRHVEGPGRPGQPMTADDYLRAVFRGVPGLAAAAEAEGLDPLEMMRRRGVFAVEQDGERLLLHEHEVAADAPGVEIEGVRRRGFDTPSRRIELYSSTLAEWGWPEHALPGAIESQVAPAQLEPGEMALVPTFRLPVLIHSRSGNAKWLLEIAHSNPLWLHPSDAERLGIGMGELAKVSTRMGSFVVRAWVTEGIRPGIVACSHHLGRWRKEGEASERGQGSERESAPKNRWSAAPVRFEDDGEKLLVRRTGELSAFASEDSDSERLWWKEVGVHQNMTFPVQPDPISGMHCWHQPVRVEPAGPDDQEGDVRVDRARAREVYRAWMEKARPMLGPGGLRRPLWLKRPIRPREEAFYVKTAAGQEQGQAEHEPAEKSATSDAATSDAATSDAATSDAATSDAATSDAATSDAATSDAATSDAG
ncbi:MAG: molybdopterin dinucleotide binding domain-containing protein [Planctomycetota bacterium]